MDQIRNPHQDRPTAPSSTSTSKPNPSSTAPASESTAPASKAGGKSASEAKAAETRAAARQSIPHTGVKITDPNLIKRLDTYSIEDIVELKIARFLDQLGGFYPENMHELIMCKVEKPLIVQILRQVGGNQVHASKILGINRNTLRKKMKLYSIGVS